MFKSILIISPAISPNIGGVETHLDDLIEYLDKAGYSTFVQSYSPITTSGVSWKAKEQKGNINIRRYRWFGKNLLHRIEKIPLLDFIYITPYLMLRVLIFMVFNHKKIDIIHAHGLNCAVIGLVIKKIFKKRLIVSIHAVYELPQGKLIRKLIKHILLSCDKLLTLSEASRKELISFGINKEMIRLFKYWVDLDVFKPKSNKKEIRERLGLIDKFTVLFVGRLTEKKGLKVFIEIAKSLKEIEFVVIGNGPLEVFLRNLRIVNVHFLGRVENNRLSAFYNTADLFCIPSLYEEGYGRVVMEAVSCDLPVVGSDRGGIKEALNDSVSILVEPTLDNLKSSIETLYNNQNICNRLKSNCRKFAEDNFSEINAKIIIESYNG
ncbi:MAG: glycosyltransferase family 4 protein [Candidatus Gygaella obscura]|nr:glycosyltransferase family 4 protein [Candidatus Gygaella obscura]